MDTAAENPVLPANASLFTRLRLAFEALRILAEDPGNPYYGPLLNACLDGATYAELARAWREQPEGRQLLDSRPSLQGRELDLEALGRLPDGTLGREFVRYFEDNGIEPFVSSFPIESDVDYLSKRYRETHDIFHIITGYGTDELSEMELQAFVLGNLGLRQAIMILAFSVPRHLPLVGLRGLRPYVRRLRAAYRRGKRSKEMLSVRYETMWDQPVARLSEQLCGQLREAVASDFVDELTGHELGCGHPKLVDGRGAGVVAGPGVDVGAQIVGACPCGSASAAPCRGRCAWARRGAS